MNCPPSHPTRPALTTCQLAAILDALPHPETVTQWEYWEVFDKLTAAFQLGESRLDAIAHLAYCSEVAGEVGEDLVQHLAVVGSNRWLDGYYDDEEDWDTDKYSYSDDAGDEEDEEAEGRNEEPLSDTRLEALGQLLLPLTGIRDVHPPLVLPQRPVDLFRW